MAKEVFSAKEWFADVQGDVELSDEQTQAMETLLANEDIAKNIGNSVLRQSDYSRQSDELRAQREAVDAEKTAAETARQEADDFINTQKMKDHNNLQIHDQLVADLAEANRRLNDAGETVVEPRSTQTETQEVTTQETDVKYLTEEEYLSREAERDQNAINYSNKIVQLSNKFRNDFDKDFDPEPVVKHATENGLTLADAYDDLYKAEYAEKQEAEIQARIDKAVEEATIESRSQSDFPEIDAGPQRVSGLDVPEEDKLATEDDRAKAAVQGLREIRTGKRQATSRWND